VRLWPESAQVLARGLEAAGRLSAEDDKARYLITLPSEVDGPVGIASVCLLDWSEDADARLDPEGFAEGVAALVEYGFHLADEPEAISRRAFDHAAAVASTVPTWRLTRPQDLVRLAAVAALLDEHDARLSG
jgi:hypothetical protein